MNKSIGVTFLGCIIWAMFGSNVGYSAPQKVMIVIFENEDADPVLAQPYFKAFAKSGVYFDQFKAETHPSQPNYIALVSGTTLGVPGDRNVDLDSKHLGDLLDAKGKSWKIYAEGYPGGCFTKSSSGNYARKHVPFLSFTNVTRDESRCSSHVVNASALDQDLASGQLPDFSIYVPDLKNDGHDTGVAFADKWFAGKFTPLINNPKFMTGMLLIATFDEGRVIGDNRIYTAAIGSMLRGGTVSNTTYNHYNILRTVEDAFGLGSLGQKDAQVSAMGELLSP